MIASSCSAIGAERDADHRGAENAEDDGRALLPVGQAGDRHAHHDGVVAGERDVDQDDLRQGSEVMGQR